VAKAKVGDRILDVRANAYATVVRVTDSPHESPFSCHIRYDDGQSHDFLPDSDGLVALFNEFNTLGQDAFWLLSDLECIVEAADERR
jgi:hypothetical protein